eukprot:tig00000076_g2384.t1
MFNLVTLRDQVRITPADFVRPQSEVVIHELNQQYANKILLNHGLALGVYDILSLGDSVIYPGDGAAHVKVDFRLVLFRPHIDEVIVGKVAECTSEGVHVSLGFFDDIFIPHHFLQQPSVFDKSEQLWVWKFEGNDLFMDLQEDIRFRVKTVHFNTGPPMGAPGSAQALAKAANAGPATPPMLIEASVSEDGLGLCSWWSS